MGRPARSLVPNLGQQKNGPPSYWTTHAWTPPSSRPSEIGPYLRGMPSASSVVLDLSGGRDAGGCLQRRPARTRLMLPNQCAARLGGRVESNRQDRVSASTRGKARGAGASAGRKVPSLPPPLGCSARRSPSGPGRLHSPLWRDRESAPFRYRTVSVVKGRHAGKIGYHDDDEADHAVVSSGGRPARATAHQAQPPRQPDQPGPPSG